MVGNHPLPPPRSGLIIPAGRFRPDFGPDATFVSSKGVSPMADYIPGPGSEENVELRMEN